MLASLQMSSFLMWSFLVLPPAHLSILISVVFSLCMCHWFNVGFSPDVFILDVVLLGLVSSLSQHSHLSGVLFMCHWFNVGSSPDVFVLEVVLLGLASNPSQHSHLSGV